MKILFIICSFFTGFFLGVLFGSFTLPEGSGLAGPAIILSYGIVGAILLIIVSIFIAGKIQKDLLKKITIILIILNLIPILWMVYRYSTRLSSEQSPPRNVTPNITKPVTAPVINILSENFQQNELGLGMAKPDFYNKKVLYFYSTPNLEKPVSEHVPSDSLVFSQTEHHQFDISYAPPWFYPEHLKMDYEILYLKIIILGRDWIQVEVNKKTNQLAWVSASDIEVKLWPEFLLSVFSIENSDNENNPLRIKPLSHASPIQKKDYDFLSPVMIKDNWIKVHLIDEDLNKAGEGWLQWHKEGKLLIGYSLLS